jgi:hypothetical protein
VADLPRSARAAGSKAGGVMRVAPFQIDSRCWDHAIRRFAAIAEDARLSDPDRLDEEFEAVWDVLAAEDLRDVVALARAPLVIDDGEALAADFRRRRTPFTPFAVDRLVVPPAVRAAIRAHAASVADGHESVGRIVVNDDGAATRFEPLINGSVEPAHFRIVASWRRVPGERSILTHSHPIGASALPSRADMTYARRFGTDPFAIAHDSGRRVYQLQGYGYRRVPVDVQRRYRVDYVEKLVLDASGRIIPGGWDALQRRLLGGRARDRG